MTSRLNRNLAVLLGLVTLALPCRVLANTPTVESSYCLAIRDQIKASESAAQATVKKIQAAPSQGLWCAYNREYNARYEKHNSLMRDYARCRHLEEQDIDYNQLIADYEFNKQRLLTMRGTIDLACGAGAN